MEQKQFRDITLSRLGMGNMRLPVRGNKQGEPIDWDRAQAIIDYAIAHGINYFDTAYVYHGGESERFLGEALKKYPRDSYKVATKFFIQADPDYKKVFEEQLRRLKTDRVDFYLIHGIFDQTYRQYLDSGCIEYFLEQKKLGRIRYLGFSSHAKPENLAVFAAHHDWDFAQIQLNYFDWNCGAAKQEYEILEQRNIPIMVMEPVRGGRLAKLTDDAEALLQRAHPDWSNASWALRWVRTLPQVQVILSGMSTMAQIEDNVHTFSDDTIFTEEDEKTLFAACNAFRQQVRVPCTACRYCCDNCPAKINIPAILSVYNAYKTDGLWALSSIHEAETVGMPADCIGCGECAGHCPQSISIPEIMSELAALLKKQ